MGEALQYWVVIPAAGTSQRMGASIPKQYLPLADLTVIEHSLSNFLKHPKISGVVVALHQEDKHWENLALHNNKIQTVIGGASRTESVLHAISYLNTTSANDQDFVLVHDAARPCLRNTDLNLLIQQLEDDDVGGLLAAPVTDTLKMVDKKISSEKNPSSKTGLGKPESDLPGSGQAGSDQRMSVNTVVKTLDRDRIWRAFTPQMFRLAVLTQALRHCSKLGVDVTDEASAVEQLGLQVRLVKGQSDNIKITHAVDLELAAGILKKIKR
jgi:2-C-methyl-D-erythritol 4-phosphate cytidylyltransferase